MKTLIVKSTCEITDHVNIEAVFAVPEGLDPVQEYKDFMLRKAQEIGIEINTYWLNVMIQDVGDNAKLSKEEFKLRKKEYYKFKKKNRFLKFLRKNLKLEEIEFSETFIL